MRRAFAIISAAVVMLVSAKASANYHVMKVVQVHAGSAAAPNAQYVQLQMQAGGQNVVGGHTISFYDGAGAEIVRDKFTFPADVANGSDKANILIGTASVLATFGVAPDFVLPANLPQAGGAVCFEAIDCFTWGTFPGAAADTTTMPCGALTTGLAARRKSGGGDTEKSAVDWEFGTPTPANNNGLAGDGGAPMTMSCGPTTGVDSGTPGVDSGTPGVDSGVSTVPTPPGPGASTGRSDSGTPAAAPPAEDDSGCNLASSSSEGWATSLGLGTAVAIFVLSRRRRAKR